MIEDERSDKNNNRENIVKMLTISIVIVNAVALELRFSVENFLLMGGI